MTEPTPPPSDRVRVRRAGNRHFVDVTVSIPRALSFEQVHAISDEVERRVGEIIPADVMVHMEPRAQAGEHVFDAIRAAAQRRGLAVHDLSAHQLDGHLFIEMHLEVDEHLSLREAHRQATDLEEEIRGMPSPERTGGIKGAEVNIHIEPLGAHIATVDRSAGNLRGLATAGCTFRIAALYRVRRRARQRWACFQISRRHRHTPLIPGRTQAKDARCRGN